MPQTQNVHAKEARKAVRPEFYVLASKARRLSSGYVRTVTPADCPTREPAALRAKAARPTHQALALS